jgi:hypothetical protein
VGGGKDECLLGGGNGESQGMVNGACGDLVISSESDEDRQARRIGLSPGVGTLLTHSHVPDRCRMGAPLPAFETGIVEFIKPAAIFFEH